MSTRIPAIRIGHGYDLHRLEPRPPAGGGRALVVGGVALDFDRGPIAHSDGDVLYHAVVDAIMGALAGPDGATDILGTLLYRTFFGFQLQLGDRSMGATIATVMFLIILAGVAFYLFAIQRRMRRYQF